MLGELVRYVQAPEITMVCRSLGSTAHHFSLEWSSAAFRLHTNDLLPAASLSRCGSADIKAGKLAG